MPTPVTELSLVATPLTYNCPVAFPLPPTVNWSWLLLAWDMVVAAVAEVGKAVLLSVIVPLSVNVVVNTVVKYFSVPDAPPAAVR